ncbi:MAG TPA: redoxin domain-containing protein [Candidatus Paceibacterota bacterium]|nr:redoxin domain-containing protein [Candidatus Paceibacterota bacterium]
MTVLTRRIILAIVVLAIIGVIAAIELAKPHVSATEVTTPGLASSSPAVQDVVASKAEVYPRAIELADPTGFINAAPFTIQSLIGKKVILIDFWTYSCINCQRTIPYLNAWYAKYKDYGLVIIGIHSPEFGFEKVYDNVKEAVERAGITYPVVLDSAMATWTAYKNLYWPREYLIDIDGFIVHDHIGEGGYQETEDAIRHALIERAQRLGLATSTIPGGYVTPAGALTPNGVNSPETYFGAMRNEYFGNGTPGQVGTSTFSVPQTLALNHFYLGNQWAIKQEYAQSASAGASVTYEYDATDVYLVASDPLGARVEVLLDGKPIPDAMAGDDVSGGILTVKEDRLYSIVKGASPGVHTLELKSDQPGLEIYTFTFG